MGSGVLRAESGSAHGSVDTGAMIPSMKAVSKAEGSPFPPVPDGEYVVCEDRLPGLADPTAMILLWRVGDTVHVWRCICPALAGGNGWPFSYEGTRLIPLRGEAANVTSQS